MTPQEISQLKERLMLLPTGPWTYDETAGAIVTPHFNQSAICHVNPMLSLVNGNLGTFLAEAPRLVWTLLKTIEQLQNQNEEFDARIEYAEDILDFTRNVTTFKDVFKTLTRTQGYYQTVYETSTDTPTTP